MEYPVSSTKTWQLRFALRSNYHQVLAAGMLNGSLGTELLTNSWRRWRRSNGVHPSGPFARARSIRERVDSLLGAA
jgi:hypothetical protein